MAGKRDTEVHYKLAGNKGRSGSIYTKGRQLDVGVEHLGGAIITGAGWHTQTE